MTLDFFLVRETSKNVEGTRPLTELQLFHLRGYSLTPSIFRLAVNIVYKLALPSSKNYSQFLSTLPSPVEF